MRCGAVRMSTASVARIDDRVTDGRARAVTATLISRSSGSAVAGGEVLLAKSMTPRTLTVLRVAACLGEHDRIEELVV